MKYRLLTLALLMSMSFSGCESKDNSTPNESTVTKIERPPSPSAL